MKKILQYARFFIYHALNWSVPMAAFTLYHSIRGERKYKIDTLSAVNLNKLTIRRGDVERASRYEGVNYFILEDLLEKFRALYPNERYLVDVGCGKGRAMVVAAHFGFNRLLGIDFAEELCAEAKVNLARIEDVLDIKFRIVCDDVLQYPLKDENVFFLFNPFDKEILDLFLQHVEKSARRNPRSVYIMYASPKWKEILEIHEYKVVYHMKKMIYLEGLIAHKNFSG